MADNNDNSWIWKLVAVIGGIGALAYLGYYLIKQETGPVGGSCNTPGTPCYTAIQPYYQTYQTCANQYAQYLSQYLKEDSANGTGLTEAQLTNLNYLTNCMNNASQNIAKVAKQYAPQNALDIVAFYATIAIATPIWLYFGAKAVNILRNTKSYNTGIKTGSQAAQAINDSGIQSYVDDGIISPDEAAGLKSQYSSITQNNVEDANSLIESYATDGIIEEDEVENTESEVDDAMEADATDTEDALSGVFE